MIVLVWAIAHEELEPTVGSRDVKGRRARFDLRREGVGGMATVRVLWDDACQEEPSLEAGRAHVEPVLADEERPPSTLYVGRDGIARPSEQAQQDE
ncbi:MAG: hypothetical protein ABR583_09965 [Gaiellaceae bacterium]